jgi:hypothetical protein
MPAIQEHFSARLSQAEAEQLLRLLRKIALPKRGNACGRNRQLYGLG